MINMWEFLEKQNRYEIKKKKTLLKHWANTVMSRHIENHD